MYTHCQHTFQFKQTVKVHVASEDPFKGIWPLCNPVEQEVMAGKCHAPSHPGVLKHS